MLRKFILLVLLPVMVVLLIAGESSAQESSNQYFRDVESLIIKFERIQAGIEVAFDASLFIGRIQDLNFDHKKFNGAFRNRKERKYLSYNLEYSIVDVYLDLVNKVTANSDKVTQDDVNRVIDINQNRIKMLDDAVRIEMDSGPKAAWINIIKTSKENKNYTDAQEYAKLAREIYGAEKEFIELELEIDKVIDKFDSDKAEAKRLMDEKRYRDARQLLVGIIGVSRDDTEIYKMYETSASYVKKMDNLIAEAREYETDDKLKEAYRTWEKLLEYDPGNEEAKEKTLKYREQLQLGTTEIVTTCLNCSGRGYCNICKGAGLCNTCNGYRKCVQCRGAGYFAKRCPYCICKMCRGTAMCISCEGRGTVICSTCGGQGFQRKAQTASCSACAGTGKSRFNNRPCPVCGGSGKIMVSIDKVCPVCKGAKVVPCPTCKGDGLCKTCSGRGHMQNCKYCSGKGVLTMPCKFCNRSGVCPECAGTGVCKGCRGSGECIDCNGTGVIVTKIDEEKYLSEKNHFISVVTEPELAQVFLDGKLQGKTPLEMKNVKPGEHLIKMMRRGYNDFSYMTVFTENYALKFNISLLDKRLSEYRVASIVKTKHSLLFKNYQEQENGSFMVSFYVNGRNEWKELGEKVLGLELAELKREFSSRYNPRLKEKQVFDISSLILKKSDGTEIKLLKDNNMNLVVYRAKIYDDFRKRYIYVSEGSKIGNSVVYNITDNEIILKDESGTSFTLSKQ